MEHYCPKIRGDQKRGGNNSRVRFDEGHEPNNYYCCLIGDIWKDINEKYPGDQMCLSQVKIWLLVFLASNQ